MNSFSVNRRTKSECAKLAVWTSRTTWGTGLKSETRTSACTSSGAGSIKRMDAQGPPRRAARLATCGREGGSQGSAPPRDLRREWCTLQAPRPPGVEEPGPSGSRPVFCSIALCGLGQLHARVAVGSERDLRVVSTIRSSLKTTSSTRVVEFLKSALYEDMRLTEDEAVVGDTGGHRKTLDNSHRLDARARIVVTCNPSFWDGDFRLFEACRRCFGVYGRVAHAGTVSLS